MAAPVLHSDQVGIDNIVSENLNLAKGIGALTDANVAASTTFATLYAFLATNITALHADVQGYLVPLQRAFQLGFDEGVLTDSNISGKTTVAQLVALCVGDPNKLGPLALS